MFVVEDDLAHLAETQPATPKVVDPTPVHNDTAPTEPVLKKSHIHSDKELRDGIQDELDALHQDPEELLAELLPSARPRVEKLAAFLADKLFNNFAVGDNDLIGLLAQEPERIMNFYGKKDDEVDAEDLRLKLTTDYPTLAFDYELNSVGIESVLTKLVGVMKSHPEAFGYTFHELEWATTLLYKKLEERYAAGQMTIAQKKVGEVVLLYLFTDSIWFKDEVFLSDWRNTIPVGLDHPVRYNAVRHSLAVSIADFCRQHLDMAQNKILSEEEEDKLFKEFKERFQGHNYAQVFGAIQKVWYYFEATTNDRRAATILHSLASELAWYAKPNKGEVWDKLKKTKIKLTPEQKRYYAELSKAFFDSDDWHHLRPEQPPPQWLFKIVKGLFIGLSIGSVLTIGAKENPQKTNEIVNTAENYYQLSAEALAEFLPDRFGGHDVDRSSAEATAVSSNEQNKPGATNFTEQVNTQPETRPTQSVPTQPAQPPPESPPVVSATPEVVLPTTGWHTFVGIDLQGWQTVKEWENGGFGWRAPVIELTEFFLREAHTNPQGAEYSYGFNPHASDAETIEWAVRAAQAVQNQHPELAGTVTPGNLDETITPIIAGIEGSATAITPVPVTNYTGLVDRLTQRLP
ncbi:MAG TPA: hypothetical protein VD999_04200 [Vitreimonas sp.]|nr:hypothetical protein [Vitreimonas sp.]